ncbi:MAG: amidohydrolase [Chloroflexi bacterium]|nr:amidohydrolase [Chloroflexota bacterium]
MSTKSQPVLKMISADSHIIEPPDLWTTRLEAKYRDRAPHVETRPDGDYKVTEGTETRRVSGAEGGMAIDKAAGDAITSTKVYRYLDQRPGALDPRARLEDQDLDNIQAEIIYPGWFQLYGIPDPELRAACMRAYNDWIAEFCAAAPERLMGAAQLPLIPGRLDLTISEARRAKDLGLRTLMLPHMAELTYDNEEYDPLWETLQELGLPVSIHITTGNQFKDVKGGFSSGKGGSTIAVTKSKTGVSAPAVELLWGAVPARFPNLRFVMTEGGIGWIAFVLRFMDHWWEDHRHRLEPKLSERPSFYFHRNFWATFEDDRPGILTLPLLNEDHLMWASDYPHTEGTFPNSLRQVESDLEGVQATSRRKIVRDNAAALYAISIED